MQQKEIAMLPLSNHDTPKCAENRSETQFVAQLNKENYLLRSILTQRLIN